MLDTKSHICGVAKQCVSSCFVALKNGTSFQLEMYKGVVWPEGGGPTVEDILKKFSL